jgi:ribonuclease E
MVPLVIAAYLLNEKRMDVADIERRTGTHIVIVPNVNMETPQFELQRLRDDHANTEADVPSYELTEIASAVDEPASEPARAPAPRAVVRTVTPAAMPTSVAKLAPASAPEPVTATPMNGPSAPGLLHRVWKSLFSVGPVAEATAAPPATVRHDRAPAGARATESSPTEGRSGEGGSSGRSEGTGQGRERSRRRRDGRSEGRGDGTRSDGRAPTEGRSRDSDRQRGARGRRDEGERNQAPRQERDERNAREERQNRDDRPAREPRPDGDEQSPRDERSSSEPRARRQGRAAPNPADITDPASPSADPRPEERNAGSERGRRRSEGAGAEPVADIALARERQPSDDDLARSKRRPRRDRRRVEGDRNATEGERPSQAGSTNVVALTGAVHDSRNEVPAAEQAAAAPLAAEPQPVAPSIDPVTTPQAEPAPAAPPSTVEASAPAATPRPARAYNDPREVRRRQREAELRQQGVISRNSDG